MEIQSAKFEEGNGVITITMINGQEHGVPNDMSNNHRQEIAEWETNGGVIAPYVAPAPDTRKLDAEELFDMLKAKGVVADGDRPRQRS